MALGTSSSRFRIGGRGVALLGGFSHDSGGWSEIIGVLQLHVGAKRFIEEFGGFWLRILRISHGLFDADDLVALRALAEAMTGAIHFVLGAKPTYAGQFWFFHALIFPQAEARLPSPGDGQLRRYQNRRVPSVECSFPYNRSIQHDGSGGHSRRHPAESG